MNQSFISAEWLALVQQQFNTAKKDNAHLKALITLPDMTTVKAQIQRLGPHFKQHLLQGMTVSIKDNIDTKDSLTTAGADFWRNRQPTKDAVVVNRLKQAGALLFGKANMTELAWGVRSYSAVGGQCLNPLALDRIAGGSSGGSAATVAAGFCDASLGTDTGGSTRIPAAFCGLVGLRPTYGAIPNTGVLPLSHSHDTVGIIGRNTFDVARLYQAIAGPCFDDPTSNGQIASSVLSQLHAGVRGLKIGIPQDYYFDYCTTEIAQSVLDAAKKLEQLGAQLVPLKIKGANQAQEMASYMMSSEVSALYQTRLEQAPHTISKDIRDRMLQGLKHTGTDYACALLFKRQWQLELRKIYQEVDLTLMPTTATTAPLLSDSRSLLEATKDLARNTYPSAMAGIPSLSIPCGLDHHNLPIGLLLEGAWGREDLILRAATALTAALLN